MLESFLEPQWDGLPDVVSEHFVGLQPWASRDESESAPDSSETAPESWEA